jgi:hypothetical protein
MERTIHRNEVERSKGFAKFGKFCLNSHEFEFEALILHQSRSVIFFVCYQQRTPSDTTLTEISVEIETNEHIIFMETFSNIPNIYKSLCIQSIPIRSFPIHILIRIETLNQVKIRELWTLWDKIDLSFISWIPEELLQDLLENFLKS